MSWNLNTLETLLSQNKDIAITREDGCICITNDDGIDAYLAVSGEQIIVESLLFAKTQIKDVALLNDDILKTHQLFPLTTIAITQVSGEDYYMAFGALSSQSKEESILLEIQMLFQNIEGFLEAYQDHLK